MKRAEEREAMSVAADVEQFILDELAPGTGLAAIDPATNLLSRAIIDSHGLMQIMAFIEERYEIAIGDEDLLPENFESIARIESFVAGRRGGRS
jgi:acyl carrier protein